MLFSTIGIGAISTITVHLWLVDLGIRRLARGQDSARRQIDPWLALADSASLTLLFCTLPLAGTLSLDFSYQRPVLTLAYWQVGALLLMKLLVTTLTRALQRKLSSQHLFSGIIQDLSSILLRGIGFTLACIFVAWAIWPYILLGWPFVIFLAADLLIWVAFRHSRIGSLLALPGEVIVFVILAFGIMLATATASSDTFFYLGVSVLKAAVTSLSIVAQTGIVPAKCHLKETQHLLIILLRAAVACAATYWLIVGFNL